MNTCALPFRLFRNSPKCVGFGLGTDDYPSPSSLNLIGEKRKSRWREERDHILPQPEH
jgi:hypothetical protein